MKIFYLYILKHLKTIKKKNIEKENKCIKMSLFKCVVRTYVYILYIKKLVR